MTQYPDPLFVRITLPDAIILGVGFGFGCLLVWTSALVGVGLVAYTVLKAQL